MAGRWGCVRSGRLDEKALGVECVLGMGKEKKEKKVQNYGSGLVKWLSIS